MSVIQTTHGTGSGAFTLTLTGVTAGSTLVAVYAQSTATVRTYTATSDIDGALAPIVSIHPLRGAGIFRQHNVSAGTHVVTVAPDTGTTVNYGWLFEVSGLDVAASAITPTGNGVVATENANTHYCAPSGELDTAVPAFVVAVGALNSAFSTLVAGSGYTAATYPGGNVFCQYKFTDAPITDDRGTWTHTGTARIATCTMAAFPVAAPPPAAFTYPRVAPGVRFNAGL